MKATFSYPKNMYWLFSAKCYLLCTCIYCADCLFLNSILFLKFCHSAALQSVFPQTELGFFMSLTKRDKERQLLELTMIVTGIRLFNKECGKGGEGIDDCE